MRGDVGSPGAAVGRAQTVGERDLAVRPAPTDQTHDRERFHSYVPIEGHGLAFDPLKAIVAPRPIGWISSVDADGKANLAPYSYFNLFCNKPPLLGFSSQGVKDSQRNILATGEFVYNLPTAALARSVNLSAIDARPGHSEFEITALEQIPSDLVRPPRVAESPAAFECRLTQVVTLAGVDKVATNWTLILGEVVRVHINRDYIVDGKFDTAQARPLARCGYADAYSVTEELLFIDPPQWPGR
ncbi:flavin reductase family protein [Sphingomonas profundi]|uniref:flavin reductase family protein n=1 Tax=Alterirhizorhabdus profundi TaxID=2681549 RepID=UPI0012E83709|nr:flavin reductase family protein [Sphingomonas profundi]